MSPGLISLLKLLVNGSPFPYSQNLFKEDNQSYINAILRLPNLFPSFLYLEDNQYPITKEGKEEFLRALHKF